MFSPASKLYFGVGTAAIVAGFVYVLTSADRSGFGALVFGGAAVLGLALAAFGYVEADPVELGPTDATEPAPEPRPADTTDVPRPSPWPVAVAAVLAVAGITAALGRGLAFITLLLAVLATAGWVAQAWREHPSWTAAMSYRLNDRFVVPFALPLSVFFLVAVGAISTSRVLLTSNEHVAPFIALALAIFVLLGGWLISTREHIGRAAFGGLVAFVAVAVVGAGIAGAVKGERKFETKGGPAEAGLPTPVELAAKSLSFDLKSFELPGSVKVRVAFNNEDTGVPHNLGIYDKEGGTELFKGDIVTGPKKVTYEFTAPAPGEYYFQCDVHPTQMSGTVRVVVGASAEQSGTGSSTTTSTPSNAATGG